MPTVGVEMEGRRGRGGRIRMMIRVGAPASRRAASWTAALAVSSRRHNYNHDYYRYRGAVIYKQGRSILVKP